MTTKRERRLLPAAIALLAAIGAASVLRAQPTELAPLFASNDEFELTLTLPMRTLVRQRKRRPEVEGTASFAGPDGALIELDVEVTTRGFSRLNEICSFPPLSLNFKRGQVGGTLFAGQNRLKLVTLCRDSSRYEQYLQLEYLVYRMYQQVSEFAFGVRPVRVRYVNTERDDEVEEAPAFLIEHKDGVAAKVGMSAVDLPSLAHTDLSPEALAKFMLFQFVIGNTDWAATAPAEGEDCCHNSAVLAPRDGLGALVVIPYDFDQSGFIDTEYSTTAPSLGLRSVRQRLYRGYCILNEYLDETIQSFNAARPAIDALLQSERLSENTREDVQDFIARSYEIINDPDERQSEILDACRG